MNSHTLSSRLNQVAQFVKKHGQEPIRVADIGSDHAYLPCHLALNGVIEYGVAGEVVEGPYESAKKEVRLQGLNDSIDVRFGDGFDVINLNDLINIATICGMGGALIRTILEVGSQKLVSGHTLILQPNIAEQQLRKWLISNNYHIVDEEIVLEHHRSYEIIVAVHKPDEDGQKLTDQDLLFGPINLKNQTAAFITKWQNELESTNQILESIKLAASPNSDKLKEIEIKYSQIKDVLAND